MELTAIIKKGEKQFVALCPEVDVVSQGYTVEESIKNLKEAVELHIETLGLPDVEAREMIVARFEVIKNAEVAKVVRQ